MIYYLSKEDHATATTLVLVHIYTSKWYGRRPSNTKEAYSP